MSYAKWRPICLGLNVLKIGRYRGDLGDAYTTGKM